MNVCARAIFLSFLIWFTAAAIPPLVAAQAQTVPQATTNPPRIAFTETVFDFGKVEQGDQVNHLFRFTNQGGRDLRIESVKTSCGCTAAVSTKTTKRSRDTKRHT